MVFTSSFLLCFTALLVTASATPPKDRFWKHMKTKNDHGLTDEQVEELNNVIGCMDENLSGTEAATHYLFYDDKSKIDPSSSSSSSSSSRENATVSDKVTQTVEDDDGNSIDTTILVEISNALTPSEAEAIEILAFCAREYIDDMEIHRDDVAAGCNHATCLQVLFQWLLPSVEQTVRKITQMAYDEANWATAHKKQDAYFDFEYPSPYDCGYRVAELLEYNVEERHNCKQLGEHADAGSFYTLLFPLADPKHYQGGETFIRDDNDNYYFMKPRQYSAIVFLSEFNHGAAEMDGEGHRVMLTVEYWYMDDSPYTACRATNVGMHYFLKRFGERDDKDKAIDEDLIYELWPDGDAVEEWLESIGMEDIDENTVLTKSDMNKVVVENTVLMESDMNNNVASEL